MAARGRVCVCVCVLMNETKMIKAKAKEALNLENSDCVLLGK